jgi:uncharacterized protein involved in response to NO
MTAIARHRPQTGPALLSVGFRPFFLLSALWSALAVPLWLAGFAGQISMPTALPLVVWHVHEMVFGYGAATVAGFVLTAIPNWTGRLALQGGPLAFLVLLWLLGRAAVLLSARIGADSAALLDLTFPLVFLVVVAREIVAGRNWRNLPMLVALTFLLLGNLLVHFEAVGIAATAQLGNRLGVATLLMLISFVGGRIIPSFTRNWLAKQRQQIPTPAAFDRFDRAVLAVTALALALWVLAPESPVTPWAALAAGLAQSTRLARGGDAARATCLGTSSRLWVARVGLSASCTRWFRAAAAKDRSAPRADRRCHRYDDARGHDAGLARPYRAPTCRRPWNDDDL